MTIVKKIVSNNWLAASIAVGLLSLPLAALGQFGQGPAPAPNPDILTTGDGIYGLLETVFRFAYSIFFALTAFFVLYAGFLYLTAGGSEENLGKAKNILVYALIAVIIAVISYGFANFVVSIIT